MSCGFVRSGKEVVVSVQGNRPYAVFKNVNVGKGLTIFNVAPLAWPLIQRVGKVLNYETPGKISHIEAQNQNSLFDHVEDVKKSFPVCPRTRLYLYFALNQYEEWGVPLLNL